MQQLVEVIIGKPLIWALLNPWSLMKIEAALVAAIFIYAIYRQIKK